jgi:glycosyltransferase involved in cell wall biosynthesis
MIYGVTIFWQEPPAMLQRALQSLRTVGCEKIIAVDGRIKGYSGDDCSEDETVCIAKSNSDIYVPGVLYDRQEDKRNVYLDLVPDGEWFFILDADEEALGKIHEKEIERNQAWNVLLRDTKTGACNKYNRLFKKRAGMTYAHHHTGIYIKDQMNDSDLKSGLVSRKDYELYPHCHILHYRLERDQARRENRAAYANEKNKYEVSLK